MKGDGAVHWRGRQPHGGSQARGVSRLLCSLPERHTPPGSAETGLPLHTLHMPTGTAPNLLASLLKCPVNGRSSSQRPTKSLIRAFKCFLSCSKAGGKWRTPTDNLKKKKKRTSKTVTETLAYSSQIISSMEM